MILVLAQWCVVVMKSIDPQSVMTMPSNPIRPRSWSAIRLLAHSGTPFTELYCKAHPYARTHARK